LHNSAAEVLGTNSHGTAQRLSSWCIPFYTAGRGVALLLMGSTP
jgi:hypothetical protein